MANKKSKVQKVYNLIKKSPKGLTFDQINKQTDAKTFLYGTGEVYGLLNRFVERNADGRYVATTYPPLAESFYATRNPSSNYV